MNLTNLQRICPVCDKVITYSRSYICKNAMKANTQCKECKNKNIVGIFKTKVSDDVEKQIILLNSQGMSNGQISEEIGTTSKPVIRVLSENSLTPNKRRSRSPKFSPHDKERNCSKCLKTKQIDHFRIYGYYNNLPYRSNVCIPCVSIRAKEKLSISIESYLKYLTANCKNRAIKKLIEYDIEYQDIYNLYIIQNGKCFYTDTKLEIGIGKQKNQSNIFSIDRIIPSRGYTKNNIVLCAKQINTVKNNLSLDQIEKWMPDWHKRIVTYLATLPSS